MVEDIKNIPAEIPLNTSPDLSCGYHYDPQRDIAPVDQFGFVDLRDAFVNGVVPGSMSFDEASFNGVEDPSVLLGSSRDVFESIRKAQSVVDARSRAAAAEAAAASSASNE